MIGTCKECGTEKDIHGNGLCNACHQKNWRKAHPSPVIPGKAERDQQGKVRKIGSAILDQYNKSIDLNQIVPGTIPDELLESLKIVGDTILYGSRVTTPATSEEGDDGDDDYDDDAGEKTAPAVPVKDPLLKQDVIDALLEHGINHSTAILHTHDSYKPGMTFDEWFDAAFVRATGLRNATKISPVALPSKPEPVVEERNAAPEEGRCVTEPVEEVSNATEQPSVALPDAAGIRNVTPASSTTVTAEPEGRNAIEPCTLPAVIPDMPAEVGGPPTQPETETPNPPPAPKKRGRPVGSGKKKTEANLLPIINPAIKPDEQEDVDIESAVAIKGCSYIYAPKGQAGEYAPLAANPYRGCGHGCKYCYVPLVLKMKREEFDAGAVERPGYLSNLRKDAIKYEAAGHCGQVMLSFTTDPYHPGDTTLTRQTVECLQEHGMAVCILTKGGTRSLRDLELFRPSRDAFASTLTSLDDAFSLKWERNAALPSDRIAALKAFHDHGIYTWVSLEPTLDCDSSLEIVQRTHEFVDLYKIGCVNYLPMTKTTDWKDYTERMVELCSTLGVTHYFKKDLQQFLPEGYVNVLRQNQHQ